MSTLNQPFKTDLHSAVSAAVDTDTDVRWSLGQFSPELQKLLHCIALTHVEQMAAVTALIQDGASPIIAMAVLDELRDEAKRRTWDAVASADLDALPPGATGRDLIILCQSPAIGLFDDEGLQVHPDDPVLPIHAAILAAAVQQLLHWNMLKAYMHERSGYEHWTSNPAAVFNFAIEEGELARRWAAEAAYDDLPGQIESLSEPERANTDLSLLLLREIRRAALLAMVVPH